MVHIVIELRDSFPCYFVAMIAVPEGDDLVEYSSKASADKVWDSSSEQARNLVVCRGLSRPLSAHDQTALSSHIGLVLDA